MIHYVLRRLLTGAITLFGITVITFSIIQLAPGDPAAFKLANLEEASVADYDELRRYYGLDRPLLEQYWRWVRRLATGDLGHSFHDGLQVSEKITRALGPTLSVTGLALILALAISIPIGLKSALRQGGRFDRSVSTLLYALYSIPSYVMGMALILIVSVKLDLLPFRGMRSDNFEELSTLGKIWDYAKHYVLITFCFTYTSLAYYSRFVRQNLLEVIREDYIRTAYAKGLSTRTIVLKHAFTNTLIPFITLLGLTLPGILSGSVILEYMFNWPGLGKLFIESVSKRDYPVIMALNFATAVLVLLCTLLADLAYGLVDPRVSHE